MEVRPESSFLKDQVHSTLGLTLWVQTLYTQVTLPLLIMGCETHYYIPKCLSDSSLARWLWERNEIAGGSLGKKM